MVFSEQEVAVVSIESAAVVWKMGPGKELESWNKVGMKSIRGYRGNPSGSPAGVRLNILTLSGGANLWRPNVSSN